jgi:hypothetical protein
MKRLANSLAKFLLGLCLVFMGGAAAQDCPMLDDDRRAGLLEEHLH